MEHRTVDGDIAVDFSVDELLVLTASLAIGPVAGMRPEALAELAPDVRTAVLASARRSLIARRIVAPEADGLRIDSAFAELLAVVASPGVLVHATRTGIAGTAARYFAAMPTLGVEVREPFDLVLRFTPFPTEQMLVRVLAFLEVEERPGSGQPSFLTTTRKLDDCRGRVESGSIAAAAQILSDGGADLDAAEAFVAALRTSIGSASVQILHRPDETHLEGGELAFLDGGPNGLWLMPFGATEADDGERVVEVRRTNASHIAAELRSYVPDI